MSGAGAVRPGELTAKHGALDVSPVTKISAEIQVFIYLYEKSVPIN